MDAGAATVLPRNIAAERDFPGSGAVWRWIFSLRLQVIGGSDEEHGLR